MLISPDNIDYGRFAALITSIISVSLQSRCAVVSFAESRDARRILREITEVIQDGIKQRLFQGNHPKICHIRCSQRTLSCFGLPES
jgi:hypothetical protein